MNLRQLSKWYKSSCGKFFCRCSYLSSSILEDLFYFFFDLLWIMCKHFWHSWACILPVTKLSLNTLDLTAICNNRKAIPWASFEHTRLVYKMFFDEYNFNQTRKYGPFLPGINPSFTGDQFFIQNQIYYECAMDVSNLKRNWSQYCFVVFLLFCSWIAYFFGRALCISIIYKYEMSRKRFYCYWFATFVLHYSDLLYTIYAYDEMFYKFEKEMQSYFIY